MDWGGFSSVGTLGAEGEVTSCTRHTHRLLQEGTVVAEVLLSYDASPAC